MLGSSLATADAAGAGASSALACGLGSGIHGDAPFCWKRDASVRPVMAGSLNETAKFRLDALDADPARQHTEHALERAGEMSGVREAARIGSFGQVVAGSVRRNGEFKAQP